MTNIEWADDRSPLPDPAPLRARVISAVEALLEEYRAGRGDVACRMTPFIDDNGTPHSFVDLLTVALLGYDGLPETRFSGGSVIVTNRREYRALASIGAGSAERGVGLVVEAALRWAARDRDGMAKWCKDALPRLKPNGYVSDQTDRGLSWKAPSWNFPVQHPTWWGDIVGAFENTEIEDSAEEIVRALALNWRKAPWAKQDGPKPPRNR